MFRVASDNNIDVCADSVSMFIRKCIGDVVPTVTIKTFPNQKLWIDGSIRAKLKARTTAFNHGKATGNLTEYILAIPSAMQSNKQSVCIYTKYSLQGLQTITDYKNKSSPVMDIVSLPDNWNNFFARF